MIVLHYDDHDVADVDDDDDDDDDDVVVDDVVDVDGIDLVVVVDDDDDDDDDDDLLAVAAYNIIPPQRLAMDCCNSYLPPDSRVILTMSFSTELKVSMENHDK